MRISEDLNDVFCPNNVCELAAHMSILNKYMSFSFGMSHGAILREMGAYLSRMGASRFIKRYVIDYMNKRIVIEYKDELSYEISLFDEMRICEDLRTLKKIFINQ